MRYRSKHLLSIGCSLWLAITMPGCSGSDSTSSPTPLATASAIESPAIATPDDEPEANRPAGQSTGPDSARNKGASDMEGGEQDTINVSAEKRQIEDEAVQVEVVPGAKPEFQNPASAAEREKYAKLAKPPVPERRSIDGIVSNREIEMLIEDGADSPPELSN